MNILGFSEFSGLPNAESELMDWWSLGVENASWLIKQGVFSSYADMGGGTHMTRNGVTLMVLPSMTATWARSSSN
jgi:hypothetical protein